MRFVIPSSADEHSLAARARGGVIPLASLLGLLVITAFGFRHNLA
jgi:hypothetical protein